MTPKQIRALPLLAAGISGVEAAKIVGVKASTISEWLNHRPEFVQELEWLRQQSMRQAMEQLQCTLSAAVNEVQRIMAESKNDATRLKAALFVIESIGLPNNVSENDFDPCSKAEVGVVIQVLNQLGISHAGK